MAGRKDTVVRALALNGVWETMGTGQRQGIWPENVELRANGWGPSAASFDLRRDVGVTWPDLTAFTPVEVEVGGVLVWSGRVAETPTKSDDQTISVRCEGWQAHLDDDQFERVYVHTKLPDYKDMRSFLSAQLGVDRAYAEGQFNGDGGITLMMPNQSTLTTGCYVGAVLDLGPNSTAKRAVVTWQSSANPNSLVFYCRGADTPDSSSWTASLYSDAFTWTGDGVTTSGTSSGTFATARRYVHLFFYYSGTGGTSSADRWFRITSAQVFADTAYESSNGSVLTADTIVKDAVSRGTMLLSSDTTAVQTPAGFNIPEFAPDGPRTPRTMIEAANVFHDWQAQVDVRKRIVYRPRPTVPDVRVGGWGASSFDDSSAGSGDEVYNRVIVSGKDAADTDVRVSRTQGEVATVKENLPSAVSNGTFEGTTSGWTPSSPTLIDFSATQVHSGSYSGRWARFGSGNLNRLDTLETTLNGTFVAGVPYTATVYLRAANNFFETLVRVGAVTAGDYVESLELALTTEWRGVTVTWTPKTTRTSGVVFRLIANVSNAYVYVDDLTLASAKPTIVDRRGFVRTHTVDSTFTLTSTSARQLADTYLAAHKTTPFKGRGTVTGHGAVRDYRTGQPIGPERLLLLAGGLMHFDDRIDQDTGAVGRDGRLVEVAYRPEADQATFDVDNSRADFDALLQRAGLLVGQLG